MRIVLAFLVLLSSPVAAQTPARAGGTDAGSHSHSVSATAKHTWKIDTAHSALTFSLRHLAGRVRGRFAVWSGTLTIPPDRWNDAA